MEKHYNPSQRPQFSILFISLLVLSIQFVSQTAKSEPIYSGVEPNYWWYKYPTYSDASLYSSVTPRVVQANYSADFAWGQYAQRLSFRSLIPIISSVRSKDSNVKVMSYIEGLGQPCMYAIGFKTTNGLFPVYPDEPDLVKNTNGAWNWTASLLATVNYRSWVGAHNSVNNDPFAMPACNQPTLGLPVPIYPDGSSAVGFTTQRQFPLSAKFYDVSCAKDINDSIPRNYDNFIDVSTNPTLLKPNLCKEIVGSYTLNTLTGKVKGDTVYPALIRVSKDPAFPYWIDYHRVAAKRMLLSGDIDGVWTDNYSPWDNFSGPDKLFGMWSEYLFNQYLIQKYSAQELLNFGILDMSTFNIRAYMKQKAAALGATVADVSNPASPVYINTAWYSDQVWNAYKVFKQQVGAQFLENHYKVFKEEAVKAGKPDFAVGGNDVPMLNMGWVKDDFLDIVCTEIQMGNSPTVNYIGGIGLPPYGKYAPIYRAALEHQKGPYSMVWLYGVNDLNCSNSVSKVLLSEAFANSTFVKYAANTAASPSAHSWLNRFAEREEVNFGRRYLDYDIGILFSQDNYFAQALPGFLIPDKNYQTHRQDYLGFATALIDAHLPYRVITDWKLDVARLATLKTLILPCADYLNDSVAPLLTTWVTNGGRLVLTGSPGKFYDSDGLFQRRATPLLQTLVGRTISVAPELVYNAGLVYSKTSYTKTVGKGTVVWCAEPVGMAYFKAKYDANAAVVMSNYLTKIKQMVSTSSIFDGSLLPTTVGAFLWKSADAKTHFVDLVNYNVNLVNDTIVNASNLSFKIFVGVGNMVYGVTGISPEGGTTLSHTVSNGWLTVSVPQLQNYLSVKVNLSPPLNILTDNPIVTNSPIITDLNVVVSPNPALNEIKLSCSGHAVLKVEIFNLNGSSRLKAAVSEKGLVDVSSLNSGVYSLRIELENHQIVYAKLIKI